MPSDPQSVITLQYHINCIRTQIESGRVAKSHEWSRAKHSDAEREESNDAITWIDLQIAVMEMELERLEQELKEQKR